MPRRTRRASDRLGQRRSQLRNLRAASPARLEYLIRRYMELEARP